MDSNFVIEYLGEIEAEFENTLVSSLFIGGPRWVRIKKKKRGRKARSNSIQLNSAL